MSSVTEPLTLLLVVSWPLLLAAALAFAITRPTALRLLPWAALPALATVFVLGDTRLHFPGALLGSTLGFNEMGRGFLLLNATLWLAVGLLARPQLTIPGAQRFAVLLLLAMAGGLGLTLAADALLFFAAATLAGYALYGLLVCAPDGPSQTAGRVLVVLLVASDLLVFELLLLLGQEAGSLDFAALRQALVNTEQRGLILGLLIAGFGIKAGVVGLHFWLAPVFVAALPALRPALVGFIFSAGLLAWLRLLPLGDVHWVAAGDMFQSLAWITLVYAVIAGLLQTHSRAVLAYAAIALSGLWLAMLGSALLQPSAWLGTNTALLAALLQSGLALAALLLFERPTAEHVPAWLQPLVRGLMGLAAVLLASTPLSVTGFMTKADGSDSMLMFGALAAMVFLTLRGLFLGTAPPRSETPRAAAPSILLVAGGLTLAALWAAAYNLAGLTPGTLWQPTLIALIATLLAWLSVARALPYPSPLAAGALLAVLSQTLAAAIRLTDEQLVRWRDAWLTPWGRAWRRWDWQRLGERAERELTRWTRVMVMLLLLGLVVAWWAGYG